MFLPSARSRCSFPPFFCLPRLSGRVHRIPCETIPDQVATFGATYFRIICRTSGAGPKQLFSDMSACKRSGQFITEAHDLDCKRVEPFLYFVSFRHAPSPPLLSIIHHPSIIDNHSPPIHYYLPKNEFPMEVENVFTPNDKKIRDQCVGSLFKRAVRDA